MRQRLSSHHVSDEEAGSKDQAGITFKGLPTANYSCQLGSTSYRFRSPPKQCYQLRKKHQNINPTTTCVTQYVFTITVASVSFSLRLGFLLEDIGTVRGLGE